MKHAMEQGFTIQAHSNGYKQTEKHLKTTGNTCQSQQTVYCTHLNKQKKITLTTSDIL